MVEERKPSKATKAACRCETCKRDRKEPHKIKRQMIESYSAQPYGGWQFKRTAQEIIARPRVRLCDAPRSYYEGSEVQPLYMGVELETDLPTQRRRLGGPDLPIEPQQPNMYGLSYEAARDAENAWDAQWCEWDSRCQMLWREFHEANPIMDGEVASSLARPRAFWLAKHDGSVSGPEFASQPATMAWWNSRQASMNRMFNGLLHAGLRSHQGDHCGMHVNINTTAFNGTQHLFNFVNLLIANKTWTLRMSQRTVRSSHWASFEERSMQTATSRLRWAQHAFEDGYTSQDRYAVLNASNEGRIEFRLPRGTLRLDRFYKNLEWTAAMIEYTRTAAGDNGYPPPLTSAAFMRWALAQRAEYPNLCAFLDEKFGATSLVKEAVVSAAGSVFAEMSGALAFATGR